MGKTILFGEPMALLIADTTGPLENVEHFTRALSGAEVNVSIGLTRLGHSVEYLTRLGDDPFGHYIAKTLGENQIGISLLSYDPVYRTGIQLKNRVTDGSDPYAPYYRKGSAASHISEKGIFITFDPNLRPALWENEETMRSVINELASMADVVLPGIEECKILLGTTDMEEAAQMYQKAGAKIVIIKDGSKGAFVKENENTYTVPGFHVDKVVDTVGAGDGFAVGVISGILEGRTIKESVRRGNAIGAIQVMNISDNEGLPTKEELDKFIETNK